MRLPDVRTPLVRSSLAVLVLAIALIWRCAGTSLCYNLLPHSSISMLLASVAMWAALSEAPWLVRWLCGYAAFWTIWTQAPDVVIRACLGSWTIPHVLLTFSLLSIVRELGLRPTRTAAMPKTSGNIAWRFSLLTLLGWVAGAAIFLFFFKQVYGYQREQPWPGRSSWSILTKTAGLNLAGTVVDLAAVWALLRPGRLGWRPALPVALMAAGWMLFLRATYAATIGGYAASIDVRRATAEHELYYLLPLMALLFMTRACGYRWSRLTPDAASAPGQAGSP